MNKWHLNLKLKKLNHEHYRKLLSMWCISNNSNNDDEHLNEQLDDLSLNLNNIDTILDDTDENFSSKMKKFNLIGIPFQIIIGKKSDGETFEFKEIGEETKNLKIEEIARIIKSKK